MRYNVLQRVATLCLLALFSVPSTASAQQAGGTLHLVVNADLGTDTISRHIYGHFAEHLGRDIYDGFWTKEGTGAWHLRDDIITDDYNWTEVMMREAGRMIDGLDLHYYTITGTWNNKGKATEFNDAEWFETMRNTLRMKEFIERHSAIMDQYDPDKRVALIVGEWGMWHQVEEGTNPGFLYQQNTLRDAVVAAVNLNLFNNHADRVRGDNIAQTINVLQAMILTKGPQMILTPTYHVFEFYTVHHDATLLPTSLDEGSYTYEGETIPAVSVSASRNQDGVIHITLANLDPHRARTITTDIRGQKVSQVSGRILTASSMNAHNTFEQPNAIQPAAFNGARIANGSLNIELPAKSVVVLELR